MARGRARTQIAVHRPYLDPNSLGPEVRQDNQMPDWALQFYSPAVYEYSVHDFGWPPPCAAWSVKSSWAPAVTSGPPRASDEHVKAFVLPRSTLTRDNMTLTVSGRKWYLPGTVLLGGVLVDTAAYSVGWFVALTGARAFRDTSRRRRN